jgi:leucyl/phenylalanyl-tRNA--protein transferase
VAIYVLPNNEIVFPNQETANDGLLAIGGDLSTERLIFAYQNGIFPWFEKGQPILWWCPEMRFVLFPDKLKVSKSMQKVLRDATFTVTFNQKFSEVIKHCRIIKREGQQGTWITPEMIAAYTKLHKLGIAHSVEVWREGQLVGGLYGLIMGKCFFGESMFSQQSNASKVGFITFVKHLQEKGIELIDCQIYSEHLESLGAELIPRANFLDLLAQYIISK